MPIVDEKRLKGNFGASYVTSLLSSECLVRQVSADTDVGVDLYCETVEADKPFLHFWVQVKTGNQCRLLDDDSATCSLDKDHLAYWFRQPVPVYAALVPVEWPIVSDPIVYIVDITDELIEKWPIENDSICLHSKRKWVPNQKNAIRDFLKHVVPVSTAKANCSLGLVSFTPTQQTSYEVDFADVPVTKYKTKILNRIRRTAAFSIIFMHDNKQLEGENTGFRQNLTNVLEQFDDDLHWESFYARAISKHVDGFYDIAIGLYQRAIDHIQQDTHIDANSGTWKTEIESILKKIQRAQNCENIHAG